MNTRIQPSKKQTNNKKAFLIISTTKEHTDGCVMDIFREVRRDVRANNPGKTKEQTNHGSDEVKLMISESRDASVL